jgi:hypothetical protein
VLFISSTSVYNDVDVICYWRNNCQTCYWKREHWNRTTIAAISILKRHFVLVHGEDRHPVKFLAGRENLENPNAPINLIHQEDCIGIINAILSQQVWGETFNVVTPYHPTRAEYYTQSCKLWIWLPKFTTDSNSNRKIFKRLSRNRFKVYFYTTKFVMWELKLKCHFVKN